MNDATWERDEWWDKYCEPDADDVVDRAAAPAVCSYCRGGGCDLCVDDALHARKFGHSPFADARWQQRQRAKYGEDYTDWRGGGHEN